MKLRYIYIISKPYNLLCTHVMVTYIKFHKSNPVNLGFTGTSNPPPPFSEVELDVFPFGLTVTGFIKKDLEH